MALIRNHKRITDKSKEFLKELLDKRMKAYVKEHGLPKGYSSYEELEKEVNDIIYQPATTKAKKTQ